MEKLKDRENSIYKKKQQDPVESFYPRLEDSKYMCLVILFNNNGFTPYEHIYARKLVFGISDHVVRYKPACAATKDR